MKFDLGAFDVAVNCHVQVQWLEPTNNSETLILRAQFEQNLEAIAKEYQKFFAAGLTRAITKHKMYFNLPDFDPSKITSQSLADFNEEF